MIVVVDPVDEQQLNERNGDDLNFQNKIRI